MALKSTICKLQLSISDMDRGYYGDHNLTIARHPSETDERMMVRILAFALNAHEHLSFGKGLSDPDEADLAQKDLTGAIQLWVEFGQPEEKTLTRASGRSEKIIVYGWQRAFKPWLDGIMSKISRFKNISIYQLSVQGGVALDILAQRNMNLQCTIQENSIWLSDTQNTVQIDVLPVTQAS